MIYQKQLENKNNALLAAHQKLERVHENQIIDERLEAVRQLAVSINHEINNPLSVIAGNAEYLLYVNKSLDEKTIERLKIIECESLRIAEINRRLLEIQTLVSEQYIGEDPEIHMINLEKSTSGVNDV
jgi:signal transduction histidine kinase